jgi:predicted Holliday junction resolvase-like endonuclease
MSTGVFIIIVALPLAIIVFDTIQIMSMQRNFHATIQKMDDQQLVERKEWVEERAQLLDRLQAPSFNDFKVQQTRQLKAVSGKAEPVQQETQLL